MNRYYNNLKDDKNASICKIRSRSGSGGIVITARLNNVQPSVASTNSFMSISASAAVSLSIFWIAKPACTST